MTPNHVVHFKEDPSAQVGKAAKNPRWWRFVVRETWIQGTIKRLLTMTSYKYLEVSLRDGVQVIKMNRPQKKNAINNEMYEEIPRALRSAADDESVVLAVLTGAGDYYSSGNDLAGYQETLTGNVEEYVKGASIRIETYVREFIDFPKILVALVNGPAIGIAATTLGLCDLVIASDKASFSTPFVQSGLSPEGCSSYTFPKIMGTTRAAQMLYFGRQLSAAEAREYGFVAQVYPHDQLDKAWDEIYQLAQLPSKSLIYSKLLVRSQEKAALYEANRAECERLRERWTSEECLNAILKFFNRRSKI